MKKQQILKHTQMILIVMTYLAGLGALFFVADIKLWSGIAAVSAAILAIVLLLGKEKKLAAVILFGSCFMEGIWIIVKIYPLYLAGIYVMMLSLGVLFTGSIQERKKSREKNQEKSQEKGGGLRAAVSGAGIILATAISKDFQEKYENTQMTITLNGKNFKVSIYPVLGLNVKSIVESAYALGHSA